MCDVIDLYMKMKRQGRVDAATCNQLLSAIRMHLKAHKTAYGSEHIKPKHHYAFHVPAQIQRNGFVLDAFTLERKHRAAKRVANACDNTSSFEASVLSRLLREAMDAMPDSFVQNYLSKPIASAPTEIALLVGDATCMVSERARCNGISVSAGDVLLSMQLALQIMICISSKGDIFALVRVFDFSGKVGVASKWSPRPALAMFGFTSTFQVADYSAMQGNDLLTLS